MLEELNLAVQCLYAKADAAVLKFQLASGWHCPAGCVSCCHSEKVEATVLEMIPLAFHLFQNHEAVLLFKRLERFSDSKRCLLFRPDLAANGTGGCSHYQHRALVCRLFGFAGSLAKDGSLRVSRCTVMQDQEGDYVTPEASPDAGSMPLYSQFGQAVSAMHPDLGGRRRPINEALHLAVAKVGLYIDLRLAQEMVSPDTQPPGLPRLTPSGSRKKAA